MRSINTSSFGRIALAGYDPSLFDDDDSTDLKPVSPSLSRQESLREVSDEELEELEERALADSKTAAELEALALSDELTASATEAALQLLEEALTDLCQRHHACPAERRLPCCIIRSCFRIGDLKATIRFLKRRCKRLRRASDRAMRVEQSAHVSASRSPQVAP